MNREELKDRFKQFALRIVKLVDSLPHAISTDAIARQIIRSGTSPAANYRAACVAKSNKDFINKLKMVEEELDETLFWLDLLMDAGKISKERTQKLYQENQELLSIVVSSITTLRRNDQELSYL
jgi:four helix bundle protein